MQDDTPTVLVVDDEREIADGYAERLADAYAVRTAYGGEAALEAVDDAVDVVLLDRQMPDLDGRAVLESIRERERECQVALVTGVEPDTDVLDMPFDGYLTKPVSSEELHDTVERLVVRADYDEAIQEYFSLASKLASLRDEHDPNLLRRNERYRELRQRRRRLGDELSDRLDRLPPEEQFAVVNRSVG